MDRNLRAFARQVSLPGEPTEDQRQYWTRERVLARRAPVEQGVRFMKNHRLLTFAGAGSALAATIVIIATVLVPTPGSTVGAATIFASLHEAVSNAFRISYDNIGYEGARANGQVVVLLGDESADESESPDHASAVYLDARVTVDQDAPEFAGLDYEFSCAFSREDMWMYVKTHELSPELMQQNPFVGMYLAMYKDGLLLDMNGLADQVGGYDWGALAASIKDQQAEEVGAPGSAWTGQWGTAQLPENVRAEIERAQEAATQAMAQAANQSGGIPVIISTNPEVNELVGRLLSGQAGPEDFAQLTTLIEEKAGEVTVTPQDDATYLLRAVDFDLDGLGLDDEDLAVLADMALEIAYAEDAGLLWATLDNLGDYNGVMRFERADVAADDLMFSAQRYREDGVTKIIDLSGILDMVKGLGALGE
jgi:hypothetical protein